MKISSRLTVAAHIILFVSVFGGEQKATSDFIASSVGVNPVVVRRTLGQLKKAGIVEIKAGSGGARITGELKDITLYDVYRAVDCAEGGLFNFHDNPNPLCPVGRNIPSILEARLSEAQQALENSLKQVSFADIELEYLKKTANARNAAAPKGE